MWAREAGKGGEMGAAEGWEVKWRGLTKMWRPLKGEPAGRRPQGSADNIAFCVRKVLNRGFCSYSASVNPCITSEAQRRDPDATWLIQQASLANLWRAETPEQHPRQFLLYLDMVVRGDRDI